MAIDEEPDDRQPRPDGPLPPDDRIWRHPSELGSAPPPTAYRSPTTGVRRSLAVGALVSAAVAGAVVAVGVMWVAGPTRTVETPAAGSRAETAPSAVFSSSTVPFTELTDRFGPSLVQVDVDREGTWSTGTGVWLDDAGTILVAAPLVAGASSVSARDPEGMARSAVVLGSDPSTGIAVITAPGTTGTAVSTDIVAARAGQAVAAIGAEGAMAVDGGQQVVAAAIGATNVRTSTAEWVWHDSVQLDRRLPSDGTGCVVVDDLGHLLGLIVTPADRDGLAVMVPAEDALAIAGQLRDEGRIERAWLGVQATDLDPGEAQRLGLPGGAVITEVTEGSPAAEGGLAAGDVIVELDGETIRDASDLVVAIRSLQPGARTPISWQRGDQPSTEMVALGG